MTAANKVLIIGGGFSGMSAAIELRKRGVEVDIVEIDPGWRCFRIEQRFDFSTPGILASVLGPLAEAGIGIFATSTFSTDYVLVKATDSERAAETLRMAGHTVEAGL